MDAATHRAIQAETRRRRNAHQRAIRSAPIFFTRLLRLDGTIILAAQSRSTLGACYELTQEAPGKWRCSCDGYRWRGRCSHSEAAALQMRGGA